MDWANYNTLQKAAGDGIAAEKKRLEAKVALAICKTALGDKVSGEELDAVGLRSAGLAAAAANLRPCGSPGWAWAPSPAGLRISA